MFQSLVFCFFLAIVTASSLRVEHLGSWPGLHNFCWLIWVSKSWASSVVFGFMLSYAHPGKFSQSIHNSIFWSQQVIQKEGYAMIRRDFKWWSPNKNVSPKLPFLVRMYLACLCRQMNWVGVGVCSIIHAVNSTVCDGLQDALVGPSRPDWAANPELTSNSTQTRVQNQQTEKQELLSTRMRSDRTNRYVGNRQKPKTDLLLTVNTRCPKSQVQGWSKFTLSSLHVSSKHKGSLSATSLTHWSSCFSRKF